MSGPGDDDETVVDGKKLKPETTGETVVDGKLRAVLEAEPTPFDGRPPLDEPGLETVPTRFDASPLDLSGEVAATRIEIPRPLAASKPAAAKASRVDDEPTIRQKPPAVPPAPARSSPATRPPRTYTSEALRAVRQVHPLVVLGVVMGVLLLVLLGVNALRDKPAENPQNPDEPGAFRRLFNW